jgi:hypothetical protein
MIGRGGIFAELRSQMLSAIPESVVAPYRADATVGDWIANGAYVVTSCSQNAIRFEASPIDFASTLLVEAENLLNHCFEHIQELVCFATDTRPRSDAWATVTAYYLGFFSASALLRLLGMPVTFLNREQLLGLQQLAGKGQKPTQGAFQISLGNPVSVTHREILFGRSDKVHEATWKSILQLLDKLNRNSAITKRPEEADFYHSLCTTAFCTPGIGFDWPSFVRNRTNYRPGYAYKLIQNNLRVSAAVELWRDIESVDVFSAVRAAHRRCNAVVSQFTNHVEMMITVGISLFLLLRTLYAELLDRRKMDRRWECRRKQYRSQMELLQKDFAAVAATFE